MRAVIAQGLEAIGAALLVAGVYELAGRGAAALLAGVLLVAAGLALSPGRP